MSGKSAGAQKLGWWVSSRDPEKKKGDAFPWPPIIKGLKKKVTAGSSPLWIYFIIFFLNLNITWDLQPNLIHSLPK